MDKTFAGKRVFVTGSSQGLGLDIGYRFAEAGARVFLTGIEPADKMSAHLARLKDLGAEAHYAQADLGKLDVLEALMADVDRAFGGVDILVNNAVVRHTAPVEAFKPADWDQAIAVNLSAAFHTIRLTMAGMRARNFGRIINISSIFGQRGATNRVGYVVTKTALLGLTRAVALEVGAANITCNAICPGTIFTDVHERAIEKAMAERHVSRDEAIADYLSSRQPSGKFIEGRNVAGMTLFLCGPDGRDITGSLLPMDGGWAINT